MCVFQVFEYGYIPRSHVLGCFMEWTVATK